MHPGNFSQHYHCVTIPGSMTRYIQPLDSSVCFGRLKNEFRRPDTQLRHIVSLVAWFPLWVCRRLTAWKTCFPDLPWEQWCGEQEELTAEQHQWRDAPRRAQTTDVNEDDFDPDDLSEPSWGPGSIASSSDDEDPAPSSSSKRPPGYDTDLLAANRPKRKRNNDGAFFGKH